MRLGRRLDGEPRDSAVSTSGSAASGWDRRELRHRGDAHDLGPVDSAGRPLETEFAQTALEELPRLLGLLGRRTVAVYTQEDVTTVVTDAQSARDRLELLGCDRRGRIRGRCCIRIGNLLVHGRRV